MFHGDTLTTLLLATLWGGMAFYSGVIAPTVFRNWSREEAGVIVGNLFPAYYQFGLILSSLSLLFILFADHGGFIDFILIAGVCGGFFYLQQYLLPMIKIKKELAATGDHRAEDSFKDLHKLSVKINLLQLAVVLAVLWRMASV